MTFRNLWLIVMPIPLIAIIGWYVLILFKPATTKAMSKVVIFALMLCFFGLEIFGRAHLRGVESIEPFSWFLLGMLFMGLLTSVARHFEPGAPKER